MYQPVVLASALDISLLKHAYTRHFNPFRTAVSFWGQLETNYLGFEWLVPKTGLEF